MSKIKYLKVLEEMQLLFGDNKKASKLIKDLQGILDKSSDELFVKAKSPQGTFSIPVQIRDKDHAYALFSDGACRGNPGPGAWGMMAQDSSGELIFESSGVEMATTNNRMELAGAISALELLIDYVQDMDMKVSDRSTSTFLFSDSKYVVDGISKWVAGWKRRGWKKADNKVPENVEQWQTLEALREQFANLQFVWVKGHAGHPQNERCDRLANEALDEAGY